MNVLKKKRTNNGYNLTCKICEIQFKSNSGRIRSCSEPCKILDDATRKEEKYKNKVEESHLIFNESNTNDWVECKLCSLRGSGLAIHISIHHKIKTSEYEEMFPGAKYWCESSKDKMAVRIEGENNPGYQHGGKLSPFSKNFVNYDETKRIELIKKTEQSRKDNNSHSTTLDYWIDKTDGDEEEAKLLLANRQVTFSLDICIEKHGEIEGTKIWQERQKKWQETLNDKSPEEKERINRLKLGNGYSVSNAERELCEIFDDAGISYNHQFVMYVDNDKYCVYDFKIGNKVIEFNGDYWHANPKQYDETFFNKSSRKTSSEIWQRDKFKQESAISNGYEFYTIWEHDYKTNKEETIKKCLNFLTQ